MLTLGWKASAEQFAPADLLELGFDHLTFHLPAEDQQRSIELVGKEILPRLRRHS